MQVRHQGQPQVPQESQSEYESPHAGNNDLGNEGELHVAKGAWPALENLEMRKVKKGSPGVAWLMKGNWDKLGQLDMGESLFNVNEGTLKDEQVFDLLLCEYRSIQTIFLNRFPCQNLVENNERHAPKLYFRLKEKFKNTKVKM